MVINVQEKYHDIYVKTLNGELLALVSNKTIKYKINALEQGLRLKINDRLTVSLNNDNADWSIIKHSIKAIRREKNKSMLISFLTREKYFDKNILRWILPA